MSGWRLFWKLGGICGDTFAGTVGIWYVFSRWAPNTVAVSAATVWFMLALTEGLITILDAKEQTDG